MSFLSIFTDNPSQTVYKLTWRFSSSQGSIVHVSEYIVLNTGESFKLSVILHFSPEVYLSRGVEDLCPLLVRALHESKISSLQFLLGGRVRVTVLGAAYREELLSSVILRTPLFRSLLLIVRPVVCTCVISLWKYPMHLSVLFLKPLAMCFSFVLLCLKISQVFVMALLSC